MLASLMASACTSGAEDAGPNESLSEGTLEARGAYFESIVEALPDEPYWQRVVTDEETFRAELGVIFEADFVATDASVDANAFRDEILAVIAALEAEGFESRHHGCGSALGYEGYFEGPDGSVVRVQWGGLGDGAETGAVAHVIFDDGASETMDDINFVPRAQPEFCL